MKVLYATEEQYLKLNGYKNNQSAIEFIKDAENRWIINVEVLTDINFKEIKKDLSKLKKIDYIAAIVIDEQQTE